MDKLKQLEQLLNELIDDYKGEAVETMCALRDEIGNLEKTDPFHESMLGEPSRSVHLYVKGTIETDLFYYTTKERYEELLLACSRDGEIPTDIDMNEIIPEYDSDIDLILNETPVDLHVKIIREN